LQVGLNVESEPPHYDAISVIVTLSKDLSNNTVLWTVLANCYSFQTRVNLSI